MPDGRQGEVSAGQSPGEPTVEQRVEFLRGLGVVPGQQADQSLHALPGASRPPPEVAVQQLRDELLLVQLRPGDLPGGESSEQGDAVLHTGRGASSPAVEWLDLEAGLTSLETLNNDGENDDITK